MPQLVLLAITAPIGFSSYCTLKLLFSRVTVLPPSVTVLLGPIFPYRSNHCEQRIMECVDWLNHRLHLGTRDGAASLELHEPT
jgi:hypothetical protein